MPPRTTDTLGTFLRDRRSRLQPAPAARGRRRTPGLRREEVAARAGVSVTWYTWLEQGRGGPPSEDVLERLAGALELDVAEREVLFLLAQHRPPPLYPTTTPHAVTPAVQRVLDAIVVPAFVKTPAWDIVAWNRAAAIVLGDYGRLPLRERNSLRRVFGDPAMRARLPDWEENARFMVGVLRVDHARAGHGSDVAALVAELETTSADFRRLWAEKGVQRHGVGLKRLRHELAGPLTFEYSAFAIEGAESLSVIVYTPATPEDARTVEALIASSARGGRGEGRRAARARGATR